MKKLKLVEAFHQSKPKFNSIPQIHRCERKWQWDPPPLPDYDLWCVLGGEGTMTLNSHTHQLRAGTVFVFPPGSRPSGRQNMHNCLVVFSIHFDLLLADNCVIPRDKLLLPQPPVQIQDLTQLETHARNAVSCYHSGSAMSDERCQLAIWQILFQIADEAGKQPGQQVDQRIIKIAHAIEEEPGKDWNVPALAKQAGFSRTHFTRVFANTIGLPPNRFIILRRIERARQLLDESTLSVSQIADSLGYSDVYFFSRQFKKITGSSPSDWRKGKPLEK